MQSIYPKTWGFLTSIKSFNLRKAVEAAEITLSPSHVEQFRRRRTEIVRISYEFKTGSMESYRMQPKGTANMSELEILLTSGLMGGKGTEP